MYATVGEFYNQSNKKKEYKLHRICTLMDYTVVGGLSKMTKHLKTVFGTFKYQITLGSGGSTLSHFNSSNVSLRYFWVKLNTALTYYHRNYCQKQLLEKHFKEPLLKEDTENSYMERLGFVKVFDNGISTLIV